MSARPTLCDSWIAHPLMDYVAQPIAGTMVKLTGLDSNESIIPSIPVGIVGAVLSAVATPVVMLVGFVALLILGSKLFVEICQGTIGSLTQRGIVQAVIALFPLIGLIGLVGYGMFVNAETP